MRMEPPTRSLPPALRSCSTFPMNCGGECQWKANEDLQTRACNRARRTTDPHQPDAAAVTIHLESFEDPIKLPLEVMDAPAEGCRFLSGDGKRRYGVCRNSVDREVAYAETGQISD